MFQRRKLLRRLQEIDLSPDEAWALLDRVQTHTSSAADREQLTHLIRVTTAVTEQLRAAPAEPEPPAPQRLSPARHAKRKRQLARPPGAGSGPNIQLGKDAVVKQPADNVTLSAAEGEAMIARLAVYAPSRSDCERLIQVVRWYFWLVWTVQEAKLSLKKLRTLLCGQGPQRPTRCAPAASSVSTASRGDGVATGDGSARAEAGERSTAAWSQSESVASAAEISKPQGGHRPGTGRLGADAYTGAERVECRHEELAVGQRCPVCGQGTLYALPPGVEIRIDGQALLSAMRYELAKLRCSACGQIFTAGLPEGVGEAKYSPQARAVLAVGRYLLGLPLYRIEAYA